MWSVHTVSVIICVSHSHVIINVQFSYFCGRSVFVSSYCLCHIISVRKRLSNSNFVAGCLWYKLWKVESRGNDGEGYLGQFVCFLAGLFNTVNCFNTILAFFLFLICFDILLIFSFSTRTLPTLCMLIWYNFLPVIKAKLGRFLCAVTAFSKRATCTHFTVPYQKKSFYNVLECNNGDEQEDINVGSEWHW